MRQSGKAQKILPVILCVLYIPLTLITFLLGMVSEGAIDATNPLYITLLNGISYAFLFNACLYPICLISSALLRNKGRHTQANVVQFLPLIFLAFTILALCFTEEFIPKFLVIRSPISSNLP